MSTDIESIAPLCEAKDCDPRDLRGLLGQFATGV
ncbi:flavin reductase, partial [Pseudomonas syringae pv. actinidiae]|nr:flavin reductase [Pseudomonas syringae pv. actinidiae]